MHTQYCKCVLIFFFCFSWLSFHNNIFDLSSTSILFIFDSFYVSCFSFHSVIFVNSCLNMFRRLAFKIADVTQKGSWTSSTSIHSLTVHNFLWCSQNAFAVCWCNSSVMCQPKISACHAHLTVSSRSMLWKKDCSARNKSLFDMLKILLMLLCIFKH